ncbi:MAG: hypothetical protein JJE22_15000 [Bacteroidia bacterium]|nr:hypothetical protein [Bacteroidia bacterium]
MLSSRARLGKTLSWEGSLAASLAKGETSPDLVGVVVGRNIRIAMAKKLDPKTEKM